MSERERVVILTHLARPSTWLPVLPALEEKYVVEFVDVPGFGDAPAPDRPSIPTMAEALREQVGGKHVIGVSAAGAVALELARPQGPLTVTAISPTFFWNRLELALIVAQIGSLWLGVRTASPLIRLAGRSDTLRAQVWHRIVAHPERVPKDIADEVVLGVVHNMRNIGTSPAALARLSREFDSYHPPGVSGAQPVTIAWGDRDAFTPYTSQGLRCRKALPDVPFVTLTDCGHLPFYDDPEQVGRVLLEALARG